MLFSKQKLITAFRKRKQEYFLQRPSHYKQQYAFIGAGNHSLENLYPCIQYLGLPLKVICTRTAANSSMMASRFNNCSGTTVLETILSDDTITGVFVSVNASEHYQLVRTLLEHGKNVFVEKPPCSNLIELQELIALAKNNFCVVGLQKRFSVITQLLEKKINQVSTYHYRYLTGPYPEGDAITGLFIHPLDNIFHLFGRLSLSHISKDQQNKTFHLSVTHANGVRGLVELSTDYSWSQPSDLLEINTKTEILKASYPNSLRGILKPTSFLGVPFDKVFKQPAKENIYLDNSGFIPIAENNALFIQGFFGEIEHFTSLVEGKEKINRSALNSLLYTYELMEKMKA